MQSIQINDTETKLRRMKKLDEKIKELKAEFDMLKTEVVEGFFIPTNAKDYKTDKGLILASRIQYLDSRFNTTKFRADHPLIFDRYKEEKIIFKFLLK